MKKITLLLIVIIFVSFNVLAQIPNAGFESWTSFGSYDNPVGWTSFNSQSQFGYPVTVFKDTSLFCGGNYSSRVENVSYIHPISGLPAVYQGVVETGTDIIAGTIGFPYSSRPLEMVVCVRYTKVGTDSAELVVQFTKYNSISGQTQIVSCSGQACYKRLGVSYASPTQIHVPVSFINLNNPDTAIIAFSPSSTYSGASVTAGSKLWVDDVYFNPTVGTEEISFNSITLNVFPNPANDIVNFSHLPGDAKSIRLLDVTGKEVVHCDVSNSKMLVSVKNLSAGIYFYEVSSAENKMLATGKISVTE